METADPLDLKFLTENKIKVYDPFAEFLLSKREEYDFEVSLLDVIHFAGHACPSVVGAFLIAQCAVNQLFSESKTCLRGDLEIETSNSPQFGAVGPITNIFSYITGAWAESGFGGFVNGEFRRRNLLKYNSSDVPKKAYRFKRISTGKALDIFYLPEVAVAGSEHKFPVSWRHKIKWILENQNKVIEFYWIN